MKTVAPKKQCCDSHEKQHRHAFDCPTVLDAIRNYTALWRDRGVIR